MARELKGLSTTDLLAIVAQPKSESSFAEAVGELVNRYKQIVYSQSLSISRGDRSLADDVFQETFIRLFNWLRGRQGGPPLHSFSRLLKVFARRAAIDMIRKERVTESLPHSTKAETPRVELAYYVKELLETLDVRSREVLRLTFFEGLTATEIAERLGLTPGNVRILRFRALEEIRRREAMDDLADLFEPV